MASLPMKLFYGVRSFVREHWFIKFFVLPIWCIATLLLLVLAPLIRGGPVVAVELIVAYAAASLVAVSVGVLLERAVGLLVRRVTGSSDREGG